MRCLVSCLWPKDSVYFPKQRVPYVSNVCHHIICIFFIKFKILFTQLRLQQKRRKLLLFLLFYYFISMYLHFNLSVLSIQRSRRSNASTWPRPRGGARRCPTRSGRSRARRRPPSRSSCGRASCRRATPASCSAVSVASPRPLSSGQYYIILP